MTTRLQITRPDDWHIHLRDGAALANTVPDVARTFARAIIMPNLTPPVVNTELALAYKLRILKNLSRDSLFEPLMVLYLTDNTSPEEMKRAKEAGIVACKLYPAGATTNSDAGVTDITRIYPVLEAMQELGLKLLVHGEVTDAEIDIFDREKVFIDRILAPLIEKFPDLKIVLEHISTADAAQFVEAAPATVAATITAHHLLFNRNALLAGGVRPHYYCLPILKKNTHQQALIQAAISGSPKFFLGTDSAPHPTSKKEIACGCAGCYTAHAALEMYARVFDEANALDKLEAFASHFGPDFYGLPRNKGLITLEKKTWAVPDTVMLGADAMTPLLAGEQLHWQIAQDA